jgi:hypothetical protein
MKGFILGLLCSLILIGIGFWTGYSIGEKQSLIYAENINYKMDKMMIYLGIEK